MEYLFFSFFFLFSFSLLFFSISYNVDHYYVFIAARNAFPDQIVLHNEMTDITTVTKKELAARRNIYLI
jgi:hypothetical protein